jgi:hypothetical protein
MTNIEPSLPYDFDAERATLGACLIERDAIAVVRKIVSEPDFGTERHALIYQALLNLYDKQIPPDVSTVTSELRRMSTLAHVGGLAYLAELVEACPVAVHAASYAAAVAEAGAKRRAIETVAEIQAALLDNRLEAAEAFQRMAQVADVGRRASITRSAWESRVLPAPLLYRQQFEPIPWVIEQILPPGTFILVGKPKTKKSFTALNWAMAVANGGKAFGHFQAAQGDVLYIDLEMGDRRIHKRMHAVSPNEPPPKGLHFATEWPRVGEGGLEMLQDYLEHHPWTRLIIIDTLVGIRGPRPRDLEPYEADKKFAQEITDFCHRWPKLSMVLVHHARKLSAGDPVDDASGTLGLAGGVDNLAGMEKSSQEKDVAILRLSGRDIEVDDPLTLRWEGAFCQWTLVGRDAVLTPERRQVLDLLRANPGLQAKQIATLLDRPEGSTRRLLSDMREAEQLQNVQGLWFANDPERPSMA